MKTIVLEKPYQLRLTETAVPERLEASEALVRVRYAGICGTDLHAYRGNQALISYPRILGHELGVEVVALAEGAKDDGVRVGDHCAVIPYLSCGICVACRRGKTNCCTTLRVLGIHTDGGMREYLALPQAQLLKSETLPLEALAQVEMLAIGAHAVRRAQLEPEDTVLVIGAGPIGLGTLAFARNHTDKAFILDISPFRLDFARGLGLAGVIDGRKDVVTALQAALEGELPTVVFDATGNSISMMKAVDYVAHGGKLVFVGHTKDELRFSNPELHKRELGLLCSRNATKEDFLRVMQQLETGRLDIQAWITHRADPETLIRAFPAWLEPGSGVLKAVLEL